MNIPPQILKNTQYFSPQCSNFYQNLVKKLDKLFNKNKGQSQQSKRIVHSYNKKDIFKWFFSLNISQKITVCSFQNKWLSQILFQMFTLCSGEPRVKYMITSNFIDKVLLMILKSQSNQSMKHFLDFLRNQSIILHISLLLIKMKMMAIVETVIISIGSIYNEQIVFKKRISFLKMLDSLQ